MDPSFVILAGPSGAGKTTVAKAIRDSHPNAVLVPSVTDRERRASDLPNEYRYITAAVFTQYVDRGLFLWHTQPHGTTRYGTLAADIHAVVTDLKMGIMILVPDIVPILREHVRQRYKGNVGVLSVYLVQNNLELLRSRMRERGDSEEQIERRIKSEDMWFADAITDAQYAFVRGGDSLLELPRVVSEVLNEVDYPR